MYKVEASLGMILIKLVIDYTMCKYKYDFYFKNVFCDTKHISNGKKLKACVSKT
jgi:hypothetical protein